MINRADVHLTYKCNLSCPSCNRGCFAKLKQAPDMTLEMFKEFLAESKRVNLECDVLLVGGEPTLHKDLLEFIVLTVEAGRKCLMHTNAFTDNSKKIIEEAKKLGCEIPNVGGFTHSNKYFTNDTTYISPADMGFEREGPCDIWNTCGGFSVDSLGYTPCSCGGTITNFICPAVKTTNLADLLDSRYIKFALKELCKHCGCLYRFAYGKSPKKLEELFQRPLSLDEIWNDFISQVDPSTIQSTKLYNFVSPDQQHGTSHTKMTKTWWDAITAAKKREET